jgi:mRNA deadenylase 3'-5' endonuclease subunit Ccr4
MIKDFYNDNDLKRDNQALFCLLRHTPSQKYLIVGNTHLYNNPEFDYVKHA